MYIFFSLLNNARVHYPKENVHTYRAKEWPKIAATILKPRMIHKNPKQMTMGWDSGMHRSTWQPFQTTWNEKKKKSWNQKKFFFSWNWKTNFKKWFKKENILDSAVKSWNSISKKCICHRYMRKMQNIAIFWGLEREDHFLEIRGFYLMKLSRVKWFKIYHIFGE